MNGYDVDLERINQTNINDLNKLLKQVHMSAEELSKLSNFTLKQKIKILRDIHQTDICRTLFDYFEPSTDKDLRCNKRHAFCDYEEDYVFIKTIKATDVVEAHITYNLE